MAVFDSQIIWNNNKCLCLQKWIIPLEFWFFKTVAVFIEITAKCLSGTVMEVITVVVNVILLPSSQYTFYIWGFWKQGFTDLFKAKQYKWLILLTEISCPPVKFLISSLPVKALLQNLGHLNTENIANHPYRIFPYLLSLQVSSNMTGDNGR